MQTHKPRSCHKSHECSGIDAQCHCSPPLLDSIENNRNTFCGKWSVRGKIQYEGRIVQRFSRLNCKSWTCGRCGPKRVRQLKHAIVKKATEKGLTRFLTLTLDHNSCSAEESVSYIRSCWHKFRTYLKRQHGGSVTFIAILEFQKSGHAHLHILVDRYIHHNWISDKWVAVGGGPVVDIRRVDVHRISNYLSKYMTKELLLSAHFTGHRRYSTSRDIKLFDKPQKGQWKIMTARLDYLLSLYRQVVREVEFNESGMPEWFQLSVSDPQSAACKFT